MNISIIGLGYVGLPTMLLISKTKNKVFGYDKNSKLINSLSKGKNIENYTTEKKIISLYKKQLISNKLNFADSLKVSEVYIVCVPTPINIKKKADTKFIDKALLEISKVIKRNDLVVIESTIPLNYCKKAYKILKKNLRSEKFYLSYCPERVLPGNTLEEIVNNNRIIGGYCNKSAIITKKLYKKFVSGKISLTNTGVSEFTKLAENAFRDVNIAYANELSVLCDLHDVNYNEVIKFSNMHPRVNILNPGIGVGGHCIAVDPWFLVEKNSKNFSVIKNARIVNDYKSKYVTKKILNIINQKKSKTNNQKIFFLGLSYKPNIGDIRSSPAIKIVKSLRKKIENKFYINDPFVKNCDLYNYKNIYKSSLSRAIKDADLIFILVNHDQYNKISKFNHKDKFIYKFYKSLN